MVLRRVLSSTVAVAGAAALTACSTMLAGTPVSVFADPFKVAGMQAVDGPTGLRPDAEPPTREVEGTDGGEIDEIAAQSVSDIEQFWQGAFSQTFPGEFTPVSALISWDPDDYEGTFCGVETYGFANAGFCSRDRSIGWDRTLMLPALREAGGDTGITMVLAHEYGHSIQRQAKLNKRGTPVLVGEQQADCFAGSYLRWVAEGNSPRFTLSTGDGLNAVLASVILFRDPLPSEDDLYSSGAGDEHGSAFERISAFQFGFTDGPGACAAIDAKEVAQRRGDLPVALQSGQTGEWPVSEESVRAVLEAMKILFPLDNPPELSLGAADCANARPSPPVSYCPATNTIAVDLPALQQLGTASGDDDDFSALSGDNTAYSVLMSRYMMAVQRAHGDLVLDSATAGLRTACLTGVATTALTEEVQTPDGNTVALTAGDLDEAVAGLLTNGLAAGDVNGEPVPAGFSRIDAFRVGVLGDQERCLQRFP
ncbi:neutral zinc metallopeptidase [Mycolicibacterium tokaiense]|jgi:predicted metalloprotease|uniref:Putative metalloprotease n=1 Tax=Mycolicibacterium tokaiense TaxID=39695 RepID=A0A378TK49_9MYCO|nr:neutral zinc metallopeptidase [Mycolicibacterium tokaiense]BBY84321.1 peptidase [Mycolicibacterium tokaiense]STZ61171.1 putative metalloprotease [Mycolicibacterium tokaiense]